MMSWFIVKLFHLVLGVIFVHANDPCLEAATLGSLSQRVVGYTLTAGETPICDYYMHEGWYSMGAYVIASTDKNCGTSYNWYRKGTLPVDEKITSISVCRNDHIGNTCSSMKKINVKRCGANRFIFSLLAPDGCPEAFCIESLLPSEGDAMPPDISTITPSIDVSVMKIGALNELVFYCDFTPRHGTSFFYSVEWGQSTGLYWTQTIKTFAPQPFFNQSEFRAKTALTERVLNEKSLAHAGLQLACFIIAQNADGSSSAPRLSPSRFFGIEVMNTSIRIINDDEAKLYLKLTVPFGCPHNTPVCSIDLNAFIPKTSTDCKIPEAVQAGGLRYRCGLSIPSNKIGEWIPLRLATKYGDNRLATEQKFSLMLHTLPTVPFHTFFSNYFLEPVRIEVVPDMTLLRNSLCYSHNDPHMQSLDGLRYENQNGGRFVLYRNTKYDVQVQVQTTSCFRNTIFCNCGVAISSGRDVIIVDNCGNNGQLKWKIFFRSCQDRVLRRKLKFINDKTYKVYLPTGAVTTIYLNHDLLNVNIAPGLSDFKNTEGLCGPFDKDKNNDIQKRPNSDAKNAIDSWRVLPREDLFNPSNDEGLRAWSEEVLLCSCNHSGSGIIVDETVVCHPEIAKKCEEGAEKPILVNQCQLSKRKRKADGSQGFLNLDIHQTVDTNFISKTNLQTHRKSFWSKKTGTQKNYTYETAKEDCLKAFNSSVYQTCSSYDQIQMSEFLEDCILDAQITQSMVWSLTHFEALKSKCVYEVQSNQPIPTDIVDEIQIIVNGTAVNYNATHNVSEITTFSTELLEELKESTCANECNGNGVCVKGVCSCSYPYIGTDCDVDKTMPPLMVGIPDNGECNLQIRECAVTSVYGLNIAGLPELSCRLLPFKINVSSDIIEENATTTRAELVSFVEVSCPLAYALQYSNAESELDYIARGYKISISNDGRQYSEEDIIVIFDSECVTCKKDKNEIVCEKKLGYCIKYGQCYKRNETYNCMKCAGDTDDVLEWISSQDCSSPVPHTRENAYIIILLVVCPGILLGVGIFVCIRKRSVITYHIKTMKVIRRLKSPYSG